MRRDGILLYLNDELPAKLTEEGPRGRHASPPPAGRSPGLRRARARRVRHGPPHDPRVIPDDTMMRWGREAAADAARRNGGTLPREWTGMTSEGIEMRGHSDLRTNQVTTFYVDMSGET